MRLGLLGYMLILSTGVSGCTDHRYEGTVKWIKGLQFGLVLDTSQTIMR